MTRRITTIRSALATHPEPDPPPVQEGVRDAAVALVLREGPAEVELLLVKRAEHPRDPWSGHMALPGGRREPSDQDLIETAVRETREETGLDLALPPRAGTPIGALPAVAPQGRIRPRIRVAPFVFDAPLSTRARVASPEVAWVEWTSLGLLIDPATRGEVTIDLPTGPRSFPCLRVHGEVVWGLTYRILSDFIARISSPPTRR